MKSSEEAPGAQGSLSDLILYRSNALWVCIKPAGMPLQPDQTGDPSLLGLMSAYGHRTFLPVHRIDRPVGGLVILARTKNAATELSRAFREGEIEKSYLAVVSEKPEPPEGKLEHQLHRDGSTRKSMVGDGAHKDDKPAVLHYRLLASSERYHLLEVRPEGGRFHQIRAQLAAAGWPIKGDVKYGARRGNRDRSIHLLAWKLSFKHPVSGEPLSFQAPLPAGDPVWAAFGEELGAEEHRSVGV